MHYPYKIAISFAEEDRTIASGISAVLHLHGVGHYYYPDHQYRMVGSELDRELSKIYRHEAEFALVIVSNAYIGKKFTTLEFQSIMERRATNKDYLILVRVGDVDTTRLPKVTDNTGYFQWQKEFRPLVEGVILEKLKMNIQKGPQAVTTTQTAKNILNIGDITGGTMNIS